METLKNLSPGEWGTVGEYSDDRLKRLGLTAGTKVQCLQESPLHDPVAYEIRGGVFAIRRKDAEKIPVSKCGEASLWD